MVQTCIVLSHSIGEVIYKPITLSTIHYNQNNIFVTRRLKAVEAITDSFGYRVLADPSNSDNSIVYTPFTNVILSVKTYKPSIPEEKQTDAYKKTKSRLKDSYSFNSYHHRYLKKMVKHIVSLADIAFPFEPLLHLLEYLRQVTQDGSTLIACADNNTCDEFTIFLNEYGINVVRQAAYTRASKESPYGDISQYSTSKMALDRFHQKYPTISDKYIELLKKAIHDNIGLKDYSSSYDDIINTFFKIYKKTSTVSASSFITSNLNDILFILQQLPLHINESILTSLRTRSLTD